MLHLMRSLMQCPVCGKEFPLKYLSKGVKKRTCSYACGRKFHDQNPANCISCTCQHCGSHFTRSSIIHNRAKFSFCSRDCYDAWYRTQPCPGFCKVCGVPILGRGANQRSKTGQKQFCSKRCCGIYLTYTKRSITYRSVGFWTHLEIHGGLSCSECGCQELDLLTVHHMDENRANQDPSNLSVLCVTCHYKRHFGKCVDARNLLAAWMAIQAGTMAP